MIRTFLVFGDSHAQAIAKAVRRRQKFNRPPVAEVVRLGRIKNNQKIGDLTFEELLERAASLGPDDVVVSAAGGSQHSVFSTIQHPQPFDFLLPGESDEVESGREVIPFRMLEEVFAPPILKGVKKQLGALRQVSSARLVLLAPPPPKRSDEFISQYHDSRFASENITQLGVSPAALRMKFYRWQDSLMRRAVSDSQACYVDPPAEALDEGGFLRLEYSANDATHANARYGELVLTQLERLPSIDRAAVA